MRLLGRFLLVGVLLLGLASTASASYTRSHTLGDGGRYLLDETNVRWFPSLIAEFPDQFGLELGKKVSDFVGTEDPVLAELCGHLHLTTVYGVVLGVWASDYNDPLTAQFAEQFDLPDTPNFSPKGAQANRQWDLLLGRAFAWGDVGLHMYYGGATYKRSPSYRETSQFDASYDRASDSFKVSELGIDLGGTLKLNRITVDAAFKYAMHGYSYKPDSVGFPGSLGNGSEIGLTARANWILSARWAIVPLFGFKSGSISGVQTRNPGDATTLDQEAQTHRSAEMSQIEFGVGVLVTPVNGVTVYLAPELRYDKFSQKTQVDTNWTRQSVSTINFPLIRSGIEFKLTDWLTMRSAFVKFVPTETRETVTQDDDGKTVVTEKNDLVPFIGSAKAQADYFYTVGFGVNYNKFFLDFELDPAYFSRGPYLLSGSGADMFLRASATYLF
jgi:hypothetical protein